MRFKSASVANIFWSEKGFDISSFGRVQDLVRKLRKTFDETSMNEMIEIIKDCIGDSASEINSKLNLNNDNESMIILGYSDLETGDTEISNLKLRINLCNQKNNMRVKILFLTSVVFNSELDVSDTVENVDKYVKLGRNLCEMVFNKIKDDYDLGDKNYEVSIAGIGTKDSGLETIINAFERGNFADVYQAEVMDVYRLLLMNGRYIEEDLPKTPDEMKGLIKKCKIRQAKIELYDDAIGIPFILANSGICKNGNLDENDYRFIVHLSGENEMVPSRNPTLLNNDIAGELVAKT
jgi:hypothetical protein